MLVKITRDSVIVRLRVNYKIESVFIVDFESKDRRFDLGTLHKK